MNLAAHLGEGNRAGIRASINADSRSGIRISALGGQDGRGPVGGPHLIYLTHSAKESPTPALWLWKWPIKILGADRPNDGRHRPGIGRGDESRCRRRSGGCPTPPRLLLGDAQPSHNRGIAIKKGDRLILSLGGRIAVKCVAGNDERYKTVPLRRGHTWIIVNARNVGRPGADSTP